MSFPPSATPAPAAPSPIEGIILGRTLGSVQLNDRVNTFFDKDSIPGTNKIVVEQRVRFSGEQVVTLTDRVGLSITVYGKFKETFDSLSYQDWQDLVESQLGVAYNRGDRIYTPVWPQDMLGTPIGPPIGMLSTRPLRWMQWSFKLISQYTGHS